MKFLSKPILNTPNKLCKPYTEVFHNKRNQPTLPGGPLTNKTRSSVRKLISNKTGSGSIPEYLDKNYFPSLDGLRGIAILIVLFSHFGLNHYLKFIHCRIDSRFGVDIFFVLSGFLIATGLLKQKLKKGKIFLSDFYKRRALRTIPLVYLFLVLLVIVSLIYKPMSSKTDFVYSFFFLKNLPIPNERFTAHLWTIAVEWQFYLVFPLLLYWLDIKRAFILILGLVVLLPILSIIYTYGNIQGIFHPFDLFMKLINYSFWKGPTILLIGSAAAILGFHGLINLRGLKNLYFLSFFLFVTALLFNVKDLPLYHPYISQYLSAILTALIILLNLQSDNFLSKILTSRILVKIGVLSFSLYIWQQLFIGNRFWTPGLQHLNHLPFKIVMMIKFLLVFPLAYFSYRFYEKPFLKLKERFK